MLLITSDTHRGDHLGSTGGPTLVRTPNLDKLAARGVLFENCVSQTNVTTPSHVTLMTGVHPKDSHVIDNRTVLIDEAETLAEAFSVAGYRTFAVTSVEHLRPRGSGLGQGFDRFDSPDVDVRDVPSLLTLLNDRLRARIMPTVAARFGVAPTDLMLEDLFVAKYSVPAGALRAGASAGGGRGAPPGAGRGGGGGGVGREAKRRRLDGGGAAAAAAGEGGGERKASGGAQRHQAALAPHRDDSELSFVLLLNDAADFEGGGTAFLEWTPPFVAAPRERGTMASFCGLQRHAGRAIRSGTRYILAGFVRVFDEGRVVRSEGKRIFPRTDEEE